MKSPPPTTYGSRMKNFKLNPSLKGLWKRWCQHGELNPQLFLPKSQAEDTSHQLQAPFDDQLRNEMNFNRLYESIYVRFWRFPKGPPTFPMEFPGTPLRTLGTFKNPTHTTGWPINPFILQTLIFHPLKFHPSKAIFFGLPEKFRRP
jgi:hypothetical protein